MADNSWLARRLVGIAILLVLVVGLVLTYSALAPSQPPSPFSTSPLVAAQLAAASPLRIAATVAEPTGPIVEPTAIFVTAPPVPEPVYTDPPLPTSRPTPAVSPAPTITPPYLEGLDPQPPQPFWIYWTEGDEVWRIDNTGQEMELVVNAFDVTGQHLLGPAPEGQGTDCCIVGPYFSLAPDQQKIALVTIDQATIDTLERGVPYGAVTAIHIYDVASGTSQALGPGGGVEWSPDGKRLAYLHAGNIWLADLVTGEQIERVKFEHEFGSLLGYFTWSPDSTKLAFTYARAYMPIIWLVSTLDDNEPVRIVQHEQAEDGSGIAGIKWSQDGKSIYYLSAKGTEVRSPFEAEARNLWKVSVADGTTQQITQNLYILGYGLLPGKSWLYLSAYHLHVPDVDADSYWDLWLVDAEGQNLRHLTAGGREWLGYHATSDGSHVIIQDSDSVLTLFSLADGSITELPDEIKTYGDRNFSYGGAK